MNNLLLDTHTLIWLAEGVKIGSRTLTAVRTTDNVYVSPLTILELKIKQTRGKLPHAVDIISSIPTMEIKVLNYDQAQASNYELYNPANLDPFDNALISIAITEKLTLVTADQDILSIKRPGLKCINARK